MEAIQLFQPALTANFHLGTYIRDLGFIAIVALLTIVITAFIYCRKIRQGRTMEVEKLTQACRMRVDMLRSQIAPRFISRCIRTGQELYKNTDELNAYEYFVLFTQLLQKIYQNSSQETASLEEEVDQLRLYLYLEALNLGRSHFTYAFDIDPELKDKQYRIPAMIIQLIAENAMSEGLIPSSNKKRELRIILSRKEKKMHCLIEDNGIKKDIPAEIRSRKVEHYRSTGPGFSDRLQAIREKVGNNFDIRMEGLYLNGEPLGTRVSFVLPIT